MTLVDTNVLIDILGRDPVWCDWSSEQFARARLAGAVTIVDAIYAELAIGFAEQADLDEALAVLDIARIAMSTAGLWLAARAFADWRGRGGTRAAVLPDFFIGGEAQARGAALLTRDARRYRSCFPSLGLIAPP